MNPYTGSRNSLFTRSNGAACTMVLGSRCIINLQGYRRLRVGGYRIVYRIEAKYRNMQVVAIKYRKDDLYPKVAL